MKCWSLEYMFMGMFKIPPKSTRIREASGGGKQRFQLQGKAAQMVPKQMKNV